MMLHDDCTQAQDPVPEVPLYNPHLYGPPRPYRELDPVSKLFARYPVIGWALLILIFIFGNQALQ